MDKERLKVYKEASDKLYTMLVDEFHFNPATSGFRYLVFAINYTLDNDMDVRGAYTAAARAYDTKYKNVERQLRYALNTSAVYNAETSGNAISDLAYRYYYRTISIGGANSGKQSN